jgi:hypothetical protein
VEKEETSGEGAKSVNARRSQVVVSFFTSFYYLCLFRLYRVMDVACLGIYAPLYYLLGVSYDYPCLLSRKNV